MKPACSIWTLSTVAVLAFSLLPTSAMAKGNGHGHGKGQAKHDRDRDRDDDRDRDNDRDHDRDGDHDRDDVRGRDRDHDRDDVRQSVLGTSGSNRPAGWSKGRKTGWGNCDVPPGQVKKYGCHPNSSLLERARRERDEDRARRNTRIATTRRLPSNRTWSTGTRAGATAPTNRGNATPTATNGTLRPNRPVRDRNANDADTNPRR